MPHRPIAMPRPWLTSPSRDTSRSQRDPPRTGRSRKEASSRRCCATVKSQGLLRAAHRLVRAHHRAVNALSLAASSPAWPHRRFLVGSRPRARCSPCSGARTAFIGHDAGTRRSPATDPSSRLIGLIHGNLLLGHELQLVERQAQPAPRQPQPHRQGPRRRRRRPRVHQQAGRDARGLSPLAHPHQAWLFFPLTLLEGLALKLSGFKSSGCTSAACSRRTTRAWRCPTTTRQLGPPGEAGAHLTQRERRSGDRLDDRRLNYQIEHHLFPSMPRPHLATRPALVRPTAATWASRSRRPASSTPTGRPCATCTRSGAPSGSRLEPPGARARSQDRERQWPRRRLRTCRRTRRSPQGVWRSDFSC
jgi:hypothetical protein